MAVKMYYENDADLNVSKEKRSPLSDMAAKDMPRRKTCATAA